MPPLPPVRPRFPARRKKFLCQAPFGVLALSIDQKELTRRSMPMPAHRTCHASLRECRGVCPRRPRAGRWWRGRGRRFRSTAAAARGARDEFPGAPGRLGLPGRVSGGAGAARAGCGRCRRRRDGAGGRAGGHARPDHGGHDRRLAPHLHGALVARSSLRRCVKFAAQRESRDSSGWGRSRQGSAPCT